MPELTPAGRPKPAIPTDINGNVFVIIGTAARALRRGGHTSEEVERYTNEATSSGSYDEALQTTMRWVRFASPEEQEDEAWARSLARSRRRR